MNSIEILIVTRSVVLQQGLGALLESLPGVTKVKAVRDLDSAHTWIEEHQPKIVLLDSALLGNDPRISLGKIPLLSPDTQRALLVNDVQDVKWIPQYAEAILIKGTLPTTVAAIVTNLMSIQGKKEK